MNHLYVYVAIAYSIGLMVGLWLGIGLKVTSYVKLFEGFARHKRRRRSHYRRIRPRKGQEISTNGVYVQGASTLTRNKRPGGVEAAQ